MIQQKKQKCAESCSRPYSVIVNSCDAFEDCWAPFFLLLKKYWPSLQAPIFLNTEQKSWQCEQFDVICTQVERKEKRRLSWSECLIKALDQLDSPLVLYFQEDYFIHRPVDVGTVERAIEYMLSNTEVQRIALTKYYGSGPIKNYKEDWLKILDKNARYRISTQASLWRVNNFKSYLDAKENGWMFEIFGTWRAQKRLDYFLVALSDKFQDSAAIDYVHTGIIKGQWHQEMKSVFAENGVSIDFDKRGFHEPKEGLQRKTAVVKKLLQLPGHAANEFINRYVL
jgi:hypothetical protein